MQLRPTRQLDLDFVIATEQHPENAPYINQWTRSQHMDAIASLNDGHFIAEHANRPIGYVILAGLQDPHQSLLLRRIVVTDKRKGYGRQILRQSKQMAFEQLACHRLWLDVVISNQPAQALYLSEGFVVEGTLREAYKGKHGFEDMLILSVLEDDYRADLRTIDQR